MVYMCAICINHTFVCSVVITKKEKKKKKEENYDFPLSHNIFWRGKSAFGNLKKRSAKIPNKRIRRAVGREKEKIPKALCGWFGQRVLFYLKPWRGYCCVRPLICNERTHELYLVVNNTAINPNKYAKYLCVKQKFIDEQVEWKSVNFLFYFFWKWEKNIHLPFVSSISEWEKTPTHWNIVHQTSN